MHFSLIMYYVFFLLVLVPIIPEFLYDIQHPDQPLTATIPPIPKNDYSVPHGDMSISGIKIKPIITY